MQFTYDSYKRLKQTKLILCNPQGNELGWLSGVKEVKLKIYFNSVSEVSFKIYEYSDGIRNEYYDLIETLRLIKMQYIAMFQIQTVDETKGDDTPVSYKEITCKTLENELINKYVDSIDGVFALYNPDDQENSLLHIITKYCTWTIGHVDADLQNMWRTFSIDSSQIYNLLTGDIAKSFSCIFQFDTFNKQISAYKLENIGTLTDIVISDKNVLKQYVKKSDLDKIATKMRVRGGTNSDGNPFDIRSVNPDGTTEIVNVNYYKTTEWMSQGLIDALNSYQTAYNNYSTQHSSALDTLKTYQSDLVTLNAELTDIQSQIDAQNQITGVSVKNHDGRPPVSGETDYTIYQAAITQLATLNTQKSAKQTEIDNKNAQIISVQTTLNNIGTNLSKSNYFTTEQLKELDSFITQGSDYTDDTFQATSTMTSNEILQMKLELKANAETELLKICRPQYTFETTIDNLWTIQDDKDSKISYETWRSKVICGNIITLKFRNDYAISVRLMSMEFDFDKLDEVSLTFSDKSRLDDELTQLGEILAQAQSTSKSVSVNMYGFDQASKNTSSFLDFKNGVFKASLNKMQSDKKGQIYLDEYGFHAKQIADDGTEGLHQMWINPYRMLFTDDGFASANSAFGLLTAPDGTQRMGINTDVIIGNMVLAQNLTISNEANTITMNKSGAIFKDCDITITKGVNSLYLNATDGIKLTKSGVSQFSIDGNGNAVFGGILSVSNGINTVNINPSSGIELLKGSTKQLYFDTDGNAVFTGNINGATITGSSIVSIDSTDSSISVTINDGEILCRNPNGMGIYYHLTGTENGCTFDVINCSSIITGNINIGIAVGGGYYCTINNKGVLNCASVVTDNITCHTISGTSIMTTYINGAVPITLANIGEQSVSSSSSCSTGYLTLSGGTLVAPSGSLYIGQNTVKANTIEQTSSEKFKKDISIFSETALDKIVSTPVKTYHYNNEESTRQLHIGVIMEEAPFEIRNVEQTGIDLGSTIGYMWKAIQELSSEIDILKAKVN